MNITLESLAQIVTAASVAVLVLERALSWLAPRTGSTVDDKLLEALHNLKGFGGKASDWVRVHAPAIFMTVEELERAFQIPRGSKPDEFIRRLRAAYERVSGEKLPIHAEEEARSIASGLSSADHLTRAPLPPVPVRPPPPSVQPSDPTAAPPSL